MTYYPAMAFQRREDWMPEDKLRASFDAVADKYQ
jgi:hypothetical protein